MAKTNKNDITYGSTGKFGKRVSFRSYGDETLMVSRPGKRTKPITNAQESHRVRFTKATRYAKRVGNNPALKEHYQPLVTRKRSFFVLAVRDFLTAPTVEAIDTVNYEGFIGDKINVIVHDDVRVQKVFLQIFDQNENLVESGWAVPAVSNQEWEYTATTAQTLATGYRLVATAYDTPGNQGYLELELSV